MKMEKKYKLKTSRMVSSLLSEEDRSLVSL
jgi:hypothetical protein